MSPFQENPGISGCGLASAVEVVARSVNEPPAKVGFVEVKTCDHGPYETAGTPFAVSP